VGRVSRLCSGANHVDPPPNFGSGGMLVKADEYYRALQSIQERIVTPRCPTSTRRVACSPRRPWVATACGRRPRAGTSCARAHPPLRRSCGPERVEELGRGRWRRCGAYRTNMGMQADVIAGIRAARARGAHVVAITCVPYERSPEVDPSTRLRTACTWSATSPSTSAATSAIGSSSFPAGRRRCRTAA